jgi:hypothetical protein
MHLAAQFCLDGVQLGVVRQYPICLKTIDFSTRALQYSYPCQCS